MKRFFVVFVFLGISLSSFSQFNFSSFDPSRRWEVIETKYFEIYFPKGAEYVAGRLAGICDEVYEELSSKIGVRFSYKFPVVISDQSDLPNGYYSPLPWPNIVLYSSRISRYDEFNFDDDLKGLFSHELTHALVAEGANGIMGVFRLIFGYWVVPNLYLPGTFIESITVLNESSWGFGRLNNPIFIDEIKSQVFYKRFRNFYKSSLVKGFPNDTWYLYGGMFFKYLVLKYGYEKVLKFYEENTYYLPNAFYLSFFNIFGTDIFTEWNNFRQSLVSNLGNLSYSNKLDRVSFEGFYKNCIVEYKGFLFYQQSKTQNRLPSLRFLNLETGKVGDLMYNRYIQKFDIKEGIISFVELDFSKYYSKNLLKLAKINYDGNTFYLSDEQVLPVFGVCDVKVKDKNIIYLIVENNFSNEVGVYDFQNNVYKVLLPYSGVVYKSISVNDRYFAVVVNNKGKDKILVFDIDNEYKLVKEIDDFDFVESIKVYESKVLFSAQNGEKIEVFEYDFNDDGIKRVGSSMFSFLKPLEFQGKIYGISFSEDGYDIFYTDKVYSDFSKVNSSKILVNTNMLNITSFYTNFESRNYSYFNNMSLLRALMTFFPVINFGGDGVFVNKLGFSFNFYDEPLEFRNYFILLDWNFNSKAIDYNFSFIDSSIPYFLWNFSILRDYFELSDRVLTNLGYSGGLYVFDYFKVGVRGDLGNQFLKIYPFLVFSVPSYNKRDSFDNILPPYSFLDTGRGFVTPYFTIGLSLSTLNSSLGAITSEEGIFFNFNSKVSSSSFNSQNDFVLSSLFLVSSHRLWANNVFKVGFSLRNVFFSNLDKVFSYSGFYYSVLLPVEEGNNLEVNLLSYCDYDENGSNYFVAFSKFYFKLFELNEGIWPFYLTSFWSEVGVNGGILFNSLDNLKSRFFRFESSLGLFFSLNFIGQLENKIGLEVRYNFDNGLIYYYPTFEIGFSF